MKDRQIISVGVRDRDPNFLGSRSDPKIATRKKADRDPFLDRRSPTLQIIPPKDERIRVYRNTPLKLPWATISNPSRPTNGQLTHMSYYLVA